MEKIWLKSYQKGVPEEIEVQDDATLVELIETSCDKYSALDAFECMGGKLSYAQLDAQSKALASYFLEECQLKKGDRVAAMMPNILPYPVALFATLRAGLTMVNVNPLYTPRELEHQLKDSGAKVLIVVENFAHVYETVKDKVPVEKVLLTTLGDGLNPLKKLLVNSVVRHVKKMVPAYNLPQASPLGCAVKKGYKLPYHPHKVTPEDVAFLQYTGGTTGVSKGAVLTHKNLCSNVEQAYQWIKDVVKVGQDKVITALPLYHIFALTANCLTFIRLGAKNILITNPRDIPGFIKELKKHPFTIFTGVNTLFNALLNHENFKQLDFSHLRAVLGGGMAVQSDVAKRWQQVTGMPIHQAYGLTETSPAACINPLGSSKFNGSIGLPISSTEIEIRDDNNKSLPVGEIGELCIRGPQVMKGYWQRPEATAEVLDDAGWLRTGDIAKMDDKGYVYIVDRKKDMILVSGFNVFPNEIEDVLASHPEIVEAAVVGVADSKSGEQVKAFVVKSNPNLDPQTIISFCREHLTGYKVPKIIEFRDELPKTNVGKVLRRALKEPPAS
ncbi:MAG: AMP-binding protein [Zetaproteobacteria bacterium]|nr:AMP-binding protein [Zetaproteobacteria bacterium]